MKPGLPSFLAPPLSLLLAACAIVPVGEKAAGDKPEKLTATQAAEREELAKWSENQAFIEWQVARLAAACYEAANASPSTVVRREAARLNASYAVSSYGIMSGRSPRVQVFTLAGMAELYQQVWVDEGRAALTFGKQASPIEEAISVIHRRVREHAEKTLTSAELRGIGNAVHRWRRSHPSVRAVEFIRFDTFADEIAREVGKPMERDGLFGSITGEARNLEFLGERALLLANRMPRLAQWHFESAAATLLDQREVIDALAALKQLASLQEVLPEQLKRLDTIDRQLSEMPVEFAAAFSTRPELLDALARLQETARRMEALEHSVGGLEKSVVGLDGQFARIAAAVEPDSLHRLADHAGAVARDKSRETLLLGTACAAGLLLLWALLRRWSNAPPPGKLS